MATDADKGLHLLKVAAGDHTSEPDSDHRWQKCPACLAEHELWRGEGRRYLQAFLGKVNVILSTAHAKVLHQRLSKALGL